MLRASGRPFLVVTAPRSSLVRIRRAFSVAKDNLNILYLKDGAEHLTVTDPFCNISVRPFDEKIVEQLSKKLDPNDIEIRPDGVVYLPEVKYRRALLQAFGPGGWALMPRPGTSVFKDGTYSREYALFCLGQYVSQARGEHSTRGNPTLGTLEEAARSNALTRCCKDLGIGSELWDANFITEWKAKYAVEVWVYNQKTGERRKFWRRKDRPNTFTYPFKEEEADSPAPRSAETSGAGATPTGRSSSSSSSSGTSGEAFDFDSPVPKFFKKYAGQTWRQVVATPEGRNYLEYFLTNAGAKGHHENIRKALELQKTMAALEEEGEEHPQ